MSLEAAPLLDAPRTAAHTGRLRQLAFRFGFAYWLLFCLPAVPGADLWEAPGNAWNAALVWIGHHVVGIGGPIPLDPTGSGDTTRDWLSFGVGLVLSALAALVWSLVDRRATDRPRLRELERVMLRYTLGTILFSYGIIKVFGGQFPPPGDGRLLQPYGESSPMGLLWTFMGASTPYVVFSGLAEATGALLLFFRRTTTLGALVLATVLTNVVMLNFCYDVPVKLGSAHYLVMALVLVAPDARRLLDVLVFHRPVAPRPIALVLGARWLRIGRPIAKVVLLLLLLGPTAYGSYTMAKDQTAEHKPWYAAFWNVGALEWNGKDSPPRLDDAKRWKRVKLEAWGAQGSYLRWHHMDGTYGPLYKVELDEAHHLLTLEPGEPTAPKLAPWKLTHEGETMKLEGKVGADTFAATLTKLDASKMLLRSRGFHWVNEVPFNR